MLKFSHVKDGLIAWLSLVHVSISVRTAREFTSTASGKSAVSADPNSRFFVTSPLKVKSDHIVGTQASAPC